MTITDVRVRKITKEGKMKAVVSITLDDEFVVHDIKESKEKRDFSLLCLARRVLMANTEILLIQSIPEHVILSRRQFWMHMKKHY